jgi:hypothetical protein
MNELAQNTNQAALMESVLIAGDLAKLTPGQRTDYYMRTCESLGLNPLTRPFDYISLNGKLTLYARKDCTDQMRNVQKISLQITSRDKSEDVYIVTARATTIDGRSDESTGVVTITGLKGDALANALMKAETKAKRRVTLSICGLGFTDETEIETIPKADRVNVDMNTGEIIDAESKQAEPLATKDQLSDLKRLWEQQFGIDNKAGNEYAKGIIGRPFNTKTLTITEADKLIDDLEQTLTPIDEGDGPSISPDLFCNE